MQQCGAEVSKTKKLPMMFTQFMRFGIIWDKDPLEIKHREKKALICFWKTQLCLHPQRELNRCLSLSILDGLTDDGMMTQTELVNKRLSVEGVCPWWFIYRDKRLFLATRDQIITRQQCVLCTHEHTKQAGFPYCSTFTVFPRVLRRLAFIAILNFTLLHKNLFNKSQKYCVRTRLWNWLWYFTFLLNSLFSVASFII